jgi:hypothetical protein
MNVVEYQKEAANAQSMASRSSRAAEKAAWLCVAQGWLSLLKQKGPSTAETVERGGRTSGITRRRKSKSKLRLRFDEGTRRNKANERRPRKAQRKAASG